MTHLKGARQGGDGEARAILRHRTSPLPKATAESADRHAAALSYFRRQAWRYPVGWIVGSVISIWAALWLITEHTTNSHPAVLTIELTGLMGGIPAFFFGLGWLLNIDSRRRQVQQGQWVAYPARSAILRQGPLRSTVVGLEITPTVILVVYPEPYFRRRIRRLVEREGQLLVLVHPPAKVAVGSHGGPVKVERGWHRILYAGPSGRPVFAENGSQASDQLRQESEGRGLAALARAGGSTL